MEVSKLWSFFFLLVNWVEIFMVWIWFEIFVFCILNLKWLVLVVFVWLMLDVCWWRILFCMLLWEFFLFYVRLVYFGSFLERLLNSLFVIDWMLLCLLIILVLIGGWWGVWKSLVFLCFIMVFFRCGGGCFGEFVKCVDLLIMCFVNYFLKLSGMVVEVVLFIMWDIYFLMKYVGKMLMRFLLSGINLMSFWCFFY